MKTEKVKKEVKKETIEEVKKETIEEVKKEIINEVIDEKIAMEEQIAEWKKEYKTVYKSFIGDSDVIWRRIRRKEYSRVMSIAKGKTFEEKVELKEQELIKTVVLDKTVTELEELFEKFPGFQMTLAEEILDASGFTVFKTVEL